MRRILNIFVASVFIASMVFTSCSDISVSDERSNAVETSGSFGKYSDFGSGLKSQLDEAYTNAAQRAAADNEAIELSEGDYLVLGENESTSDILKENGYISEAASAYIEKIEALFDTESNIESLNEKITAIEQEVMTNLSDKDLDTVMYYAEATKAGASYFADKEDSTGARFSLGSLGSRIKNAAVSFAINATIGAISSIIVGSPLPAIIITAVTLGCYAAIVAYINGEVVIITNF